MNWTESNREIAKQILSRNTSISAAVVSMRDWFEAPITRDALRRAFSRKGDKHPKRYLKKINQSQNLPSKNSVRDQMVDFFRNKKIVFPKNPGFDFTVDYDGNINRSSTSDLNDKLVSRWQTSIRNDIDNRMIGNPMFKDIKFNFTVPASDFSFETIVPIKKEEKITKIMVLPDLHVPFENKVAWKTFLKACQVVRPDVVVIIGDFLDCASVSDHAKSAKDEKRFKNEIDAGNAALDELCKLRIPRIVYLFGNHEFRLERYLNSRAPELDDIIDLKKLLKLEERGIEHVPYGEFIRIGKMAFFHDIGRCGSNASRQTLNDFGNNCIFGHSHRASVVYGGTVEGDVHVCMNVGWAGNVDDISYTSRPKAKREWTTGFGFCYQTEDGVTWVTFVPIINGRCVVDGKIVNG